MEGVFEDSAIGAPSLANLAQLLQGLVLEFN